MAEDHQNGLKQPQVVVVMVPFPAQGHLNQLLHLSRLISGYHLHVHYVCTTIHSRQVKLRVHRWDPLSAANIHFHEFPIPFLSPPPNPNAATKFPSHLQPAFDASSHLRGPVSTLLRELSGSARRVVVIHDSLMGSVIQDMVSIPNAEAYTFHSISAFAVFFYLWENLGKPFPVNEKILNDLPTLVGCFTPDFVKFVNSQHDYMKLNSGRIYNTCRALEGPYLDLLAKKEITQNKKQWALGPFNPVTTNKNSNHICLDWLDKQGSNTVLFVSFGTTTSLSDEEIKELSLGLEKSETKFLWILREADKGDVFVQDNRRSVELPKGYEERVGGRGKVVRDWAPQLEILGHPSTGGFMSHCGWNSCMESITMGVPIAAWPMHSDQPRNTMLITSVLKIGIVVKDWDRREDLVTAKTVEKAVRRLMGSREGDEIRRRAAELGGGVRQSVAEGGGTSIELESFIAHITK